MRLTLPPEKRNSETLPAEVVIVLAFLIIIM